MELRKAFAAIVMGFAFTSAQGTLITIDDRVASGNITADEIVVDSIVETYDPAESSGNDVKRPMASTTVLPLTLVQITTTTVPEPGTFLLFGTGLVLLALRRRTAGR